MGSVFRFVGDMVTLCYYPRMTPTRTQDSLPIMVLIVLSACFFLVMAVSLMMGPLLVDLSDEFDTSLAVAGQFASANFIGWAIIAPLVGPISDSYGRRPIALTGLGLITLGLMVSAVSANYEMMFAFRIVTGLRVRDAPAQQRKCGPAHGVLRYA
jgi:predicted MFS family arabinose efflux permease